MEPQGLTFLPQLDRFHICQHCCATRANYVYKVRSPHVAMYLNLTLDLEVHRHFYLKVTSTLPRGNTSPQHMNRKKIMYSRLLLGRLWGLHYN